MVDGGSGSGGRFGLLGAEGSSERWSRDGGCHSLPLSGLQRDLCLKRSFLAPSIVDAARLAVGECQNQFRHERWNCSAGRDPAVFGQQLTSGTKETAFVYAVMAAGLVHAVTRFCSHGNISECGCDARLQGAAEAGEAWHWGGCSDHVQYGTGFSRRFLSAHVAVNASARTRAHALLRMNQHNSEAGRQSPLSWRRVLPPGGGGDYVDGLSLPRRFGLVRRQDVLADDGAVRPRRRLLEGALRRQRAPQEEGARSWCAGAPPAGQAPLGLRQQVAQLLRGGPSWWRVGHQGAPLQPHLWGAGRLQAAVLRARLQHARGAPRPPMRLQVRVVLLRAMSPMREHERHARLQVKRLGLVPSPESATSQTPKRFRTPLPAGKDELEPS
ncbi:protein Wnt-16 isoform 2-T2 [Syngnathus typhle]